MTTWLKGSTTYANLFTDLAALICGETADGVGTTCAVGDRWSRVDASDDTLMSHSSADVALGNMSNRAGYAALLSHKATVASNTDGGQTYLQSVCKQTNIFTSAPGSATRWGMLFTVSGANSVAGNYSTAVIGYFFVNLDTGATIYNTSTLLSAGGTFTINGAVFTFSDPSGILTVGTRWVRAATTTYVGGVDWWGPLYQKRRAAATFSVSPPGVAGTDYAQIDEVATGGAVSNSVITAYGGGGLLSGLGIKTNTALTGALYTYSYSAAQHTVRFHVGSAAGYVDCTFGGRRVNDSGTWRQVAGTTVDRFLRLAQTVASVTSGMAIQYWLAVSATRIVAVLNADPAQTGKLTCNALGTFNARYGSGYDKFPIFVGHTVQDTTTNSGNLNPLVCNGGMSLYQQKIRQDSSEGRDWQTGWSRCERFNIVSGSPSTDELFYAFGLNSVGSTFYTVIGQSFYTGMMQFVNSGFRTGSDLYSQHGREEKPSRFDNKWHLYPLWFEDAPRQSSNDSNVWVGSLHRGKLDSVPFIPGDSWVSGDELTDSVSGNKYFLVAADYHGSGCNQRMTVSTSPVAYGGGAAILENA